MVKSLYIPERGDIVYITLDPSLGHEQKGRRPALVLSKYKYNSTSGLMILLPITSKEKGYPFEIKLNLKKIKGVVLCDQIKSLDWGERRVEFADKVDDDFMIDINKLINVLVF